MRNNAIVLRRVLGGLFVAGCVLLSLAATAGAKQPVLQSMSYPDMTTFQCRSDLIPIHPGQNINDFNVSTPCPNATTVSGPLDAASVFGPGSTADGFVTRFQPSMVEQLPDGSVRTPSVWDLHLHHVVWITDDGPTFASGEEKTIATMPQGYGIEVNASDTWGVNQMIHSLNATEGREVYLTWQMDWVPQTEPPRTDIHAAKIRWMDVAGSPHVYPVFDAEKGFDTNGDGKYVFPDDVPTDPSQPGYEERSNISDAREWTIGPQGATLVFGAGHLHPGGMHVDLRVARDGPDPGTTPGDSDGEIKRLFRSDAHYYEPAGAVSWDVAMTATPRDWRISLKPGDLVSINVTYNVKRASWYESMGILPLAWTKADDPLAKDPWDDGDAVKAMYKEKGTLTHRRLPENIDFKARKNLGLADPRDLPGAGPVQGGGIDVNSFYFTQGGFSAIRGFPSDQMRPPVIHPGETVTFTNQDALFGQTNEQQAWHSITSCRAPCNKGSGIGYPLANGPIKFDSGQLGYGTGPSSEVTTGSNVYTTPALTASPNATKRGTTYTYFCRIHPFMRGSIRVKDW
jgi:plastocyanin